MSALKALVMAPCEIVSTLSVTLSDPLPSASSVLQLYEPCQTPFSVTLSPAKAGKARPRSSSAKRDARMSERLAGDGLGRADAGPLERALADVDLHAVRHVDAVHLDRAAALVVDLVVEGLDLVVVLGRGAVVRAARDQRAGGLAGLVRRGSERAGEEQRAARDDVGDQRAGHAQLVDQHRRVGAEAALAVGVFALAADRALPGAGDRERDAGPSWRHDRDEQEKRNELAHAVSFERPRAPRTR